MIKHNKYEGDKGGYEFSLENFLSVSLERWCEDRETFWCKEGGPSDIENEKEIDNNIFELASKIYDTSKAPINSEDITNALRKIDINNFPSQKDDILESDFWKYLWEHLEIFLASDSIGKWEAAACNMLRFFFIFIMYVRENIEVPKPVSLFLKLVIRNFVWGFDSECVILCRSAMEATFREVVTLEMLEHFLGSRRNKEYSLIDYIYTAKNEGMISEELIDKANIIRIRANKALHYDPNATKDILGTVSDTFKVIVGLCCYG